MNQRLKSRRTNHYQRLGEKLLVEFKSSADKYNLNEHLHMSGRESFPDEIMITGQTGVICMMSVFIPSFTPKLTRCWCFYKVDPPLAHLRDLIGYMCESNLT